MSPEWGSAGSWARTCPKSSSKNWRWGLPWLPVWSLASRNVSPRSVLWVVDHPRNVSVVVIPGVYCEWLIIPGMLVSWSSQECIVSWSSQEQQIDFKSQEQYWCPHTSSTSFLSSRGQMCRRHCLVPGSQHLKTILLLGYKLAVVIRQHYSCVVTNLLWWPCNINITLAYTYYGDQATLLLCRYKLAAVIRQCRYMHTCHC